MRGLQAVAASGSAFWVHVAFMATAAFVLAYIFDYQPQARGFITLTPEQDQSQIAFRVSNVGGFEVLNTRYPASQVTQALMDELAKKLLGQPSRFG